MGSLPIIQFNGRMIAWLLFLIGSQVQLSPIHAQQRLELRRVSVLKDPDGRAGITSHTVGLGVSDSQGRVFLPNGHTSSEIAVYDQSGALIHVIGRFGAGPGEYRHIQSLEVDRQGRLHVFDLKNNRQTILSPTFELVATRPVGIPMNSGGVARFPGDTLVVSFHLRGPQTIGMPIHVVDPEGNRVRSLGDTRPVRPDNSDVIHIRYLAAADDRRFWAAHINQYAIELWNLGGMKEKTIRRNVDWFRPWFSRPPLRTPDRPPEPMVRAFRRRADGLLAVMILVPDPEWQSALRLSNSSFGGYNPDPPDGYWDTVLEILDERSGRLVASRRVDQELKGFADDSHFLAYREGSDGEPHAELWQFTIIQ